MWLSNGNANTKHITTTQVPFFCLYFIHKFHMKMCSFLEFVKIRLDTCLMRQISFLIMKVSESFLFCFALSPLVCVSTKKKEQQTRMNTRTLKTNHQILLTLCILHNYFLFLCFSVFDIIFFCLYAKVHAKITMFEFNFMNCLKILSLRSHSITK